MQPRPVRPWSPRAVVACLLAASCGSGAGGPSGSGGVGTGGRPSASGSGGRVAGRGGGGAATGGVVGAGGAATGGSASGGNGSAGTPSTGTAGGTGAVGRGGGATGNGATGGAGPANGTGGAAGRPVANGGSTGVKLGTGGPFVFPQERPSGMCMLTSVANASPTVRAAYDAWKVSFVSATGAGAAGNLRVVRTSDNDDTVSEGIGYGMVAAAYLADRPTFDGLWSYAKSHFTSRGLMHWQISSSNAVIGMGSATDADEDIAWALLMASNQWSSATYLDDARAQIAAMLASSVAADGMLKPGDGWGSSNVTYPDYFSPAYFFAFAAATNNQRWMGDILDRNYAILMNVSGTYGLVPDRTTGTYQNMGTYSYDACRMPWRIAMHYCFTGDARAKAYLTKVGAFFDGIGAANIVDGYSLTGMPMPSSPNKNMAFIGPAGVAGMTGYPKLLDDAFTYGAMGLGDQNYYPQSLKIMTMLMMSGNFLDYTRL